MSVKPVPMALIDPKTAKSAMNALMYELPAGVCIPMLDKPMRRPAKPAMISIAPKSFKRIAHIYMLVWPHARTTKKGHDIKKEPSVKGFIRPNNQVPDGRKLR